MVGFVGIYPTANGQTNRVIAALDKIIEDYDNCVAASCGSLLGARAVLLRRSFSSSSASARSADHRMFASLHRLIR
jgi:hypothetical protein